MNKIEIYQNPQHDIELQVHLDDETVWLNKQQLAHLFDRDRTVITRHINNIFNEGELEKEMVCAFFAHTTQHGAIEGKTQRKKVEYFNLDVIISVGYRVKSKNGTQFRQWATKRLKDFLVQGYSINEARLAQKQQEVEYLKTGIRILGRAIENKVDTVNDQILDLFSQGLSLLDDTIMKHLILKERQLVTSIILPRSSI